MKITLLLVALCLAIGLASAVHHRPHGLGGLWQPKLINRPIIDALGPRQRRWASSGVKGGHTDQAPPRPLALNVRKGEYVCGNKICKLQPGVEPKGCHGVCQYPVLP